MSKPQDVAPTITEEERRRIEKLLDRLDIAAEDAARSARGVAGKNISSAKYTDAYNTALTELLKSENLEAPKMPVRPLVEDGPVKLESER